MQLLVALSSLLGIEIDVLKERLQRHAIVIATLAAFLAIAVTFLLVALHAALVIWIGPIWAPLAIAGAALLIALIVYVWMRAADNARQRREASKRRSSETTAMVTTAALTALPLAMKSPLVRSAIIPSALALGALFLFSRSGSDRKPD